MGVPGDVFRDAIADHEKSYDNWAEERTEPVALGRDQLKIISLKDVGLMEADGSWTGQWGIWSKHDFLTNRRAQNLAMTTYMENNQKYLHGGLGTLDVFDYRGQKIVGIVRTFKITPVGLMAAAHAEGHGGVRAYIKYQKKNGWVSDFDELDDKTRMRYPRIEIRLRKFESMPYND